MALGARMGKTAVLYASTPNSTYIRQLGAPARAVIGCAGKARTTAMACAMARMRNAAGAVEGGSIVCAASSPSR